MKKITNIFLAFVIIASSLLIRPATVTAETTITNVEITYDTSKVAVSTKLTGAQVSSLFTNSLNSQAGPQAHLDTSSNYTHLVKKEGSSYTDLSNSNEYLNTTDEYYFLFNVEENPGYVFGDDFPVCSINGEPADDLVWRAHLPDGDLNVYKRVYVTNQDWVFSVNITLDYANVARGSSYGFVANVDASSNSIKGINWSIEDNNSSNTYIDSSGILVVDSEETSSMITVKAASVFNPDCYDTAIAYIVNEEPYIESVTISPKTKTLRKGENFSFDVTVIGTDYHDVKWYLNGNSAAETKVYEGTVYIASDEAASTLTLTAVSVRDSNKYDTATITVIPPEVITNVDITYTESDDLRLTPYKTGNDITNALIAATAYSSGSSTHIDKSINYTHLVKKRASGFVEVTGTEEYLNETDEYYFCFNVENNDGYIFGDALPVCTVNGEAADLVVWRAQSPSGDINVLKHVSLEGQNDDKISFEANGGSGTMSLKYVKDGSDYTVPDCDFTPAYPYMVFSHWTVSGRSGKFYPGDVISNVTSDLTLTAQWIERTLNAWIDDSGILHWEALDGADYYMFGFDDSWSGSVSGSGDLCVDLYAYCASHYLSSGTHQIQLLAADENDRIISATWIGSYTYKAASANEVVVEFISNGQVIARRTGNKVERLMHFVDENPVNPIGPEGYVFSWWHLDPALEEYFEDRYMTLQDLKDYNGGKLYARWALGITEISVIQVTPPSAGMSAQEYKDNYIDQITAADAYRYDTLEPEGIFVKSGKSMVEYNEEFSVGNTYYLKMNMRFLKYSNYRYAYDLANNEFLVDDFYLNYMKVEPVIESAGANYCEFYLPLYCPAVIVDPTKTMALGSSMDLEFKTDPAETVYHNVVYYSNDTDVVTVDSDGKMTAVGKGSAHVWVYLRDGLNMILGSARTYVTVTDDSDYVRIHRESRLSESIKVADELKNVLGIEKFDNIIIAKDSDFADALSGSYLAARKNAPILLVNNDNHQEAYDYIGNSLKSGGTVYILGGNNAVSYSFEENIGSGINVKRIEGSSRYMTNLDILKEAGMTSSGDIFVVTGSGYADSLSSASVGLPILMVDNNSTSLKNSQKKFLQANVTGRIYILGDTPSVSKALEKQLKTYGKVTRIGGSSRWETTKLIAQKFFTNPEYVTLATGNDFADGLIASPLAYALHSPLLMCASNKTGQAKTYVSARPSITKAYIVGSKDNISDEAARKILLLDESTVIVER